MKRPQKGTQGATKERAKTRRPRPADLPSEVLADLARSGLDARTALALGIEALDQAAARRLTGMPTASAAYRIPYPNPDGGPTAFYRLRFLEPPRGFAKAKAQRYWQPPKTLPRFYFPPTYPGWSVAVADPGTELWVTEGEKKAARAGVAGLACVGLGGVWAWRSKSSEVALLEDFRLVAWTGRPVVLAFDSDAREKVDVARALNALARELERLGARVFVVDLPEVDGGRAGLDDFLEARGAKALRALERRPASGDAAAELEALNAELACVEETNAILVLGTGRFARRADLVDVTYAHRRLVTFDAAGRPREASLVAEWLRWPGRRTYRRLTYAPGRPRDLPDGARNTWSGWGVGPQRGDVSLWTRLVDHLLADVEPAHKRWFLQWCAYPLQRPGTKLYTSVVLWALGTGVGKSLVGMTLGRLYGENFAVVRQEQLHRDFNGWAANKQFALGDEITGSDRRRDADLIKNLITQEVVEINQKYQPPYVVPDCLNYLFTSNHPDAFFLDDRDRRFFVVEVEGSPLDQAFYDEYDAWYRSDAGAGALLWHLRHRVDVSDFNPRGRAPVTAAKLDMAELSLGDLDAWARRVAGDPDAALTVDGVPLPHALWTLKELVALYDPDGSKRTAGVAVAKALRRAGLRPLAPTRSPLTGVARYWALRDPARWRRASHDQRRAGYEDTRRSQEARNAVLVSLRPGTRAAKF